MAQKINYIFSNPNIKLTQAECHCSLEDFYKNVAVKAGAVINDGTRFDCTKISVSQTVMDEIYQFYYEDPAGYKNSQINMLWLGYGPKTDLEDKEYIAKIEHGFIYKEA